MGGRQGLTATHLMPATSSTHQGSLWGRRTSELSHVQCCCPFPSQCTQPWGVRGAESKSVEKQINGKEERWSQERRRERGEKMERDREKSDKRCTGRKLEKKKQLRGVETRKSSDGDTGREDQLPGSPVFGLRITSSVALLKISLLIFTSAGPYTPARTEVSPGEKAWASSPASSLPLGSDTRHLTLWALSWVAKGPHVTLTLAHPLLAAIP